MTFTITSNDVIMFFGLAFLGWLAGNVGSLVGIVVTAVHTPSLDGQKMWTVAGMLQMLGGLQVLKVPVALVLAGVAMYFFPDWPARASMAFCAVLGCAVMVIVGLFSRK